MALGAPAFLQSEGEVLKSRIIFSCGDATPLMNLPPEEEAKPPYQGSQISS